MTVCHKVRKLFADPGYYETLSNTANPRNISLFATPSHTSCDRTPIKGKFFKLFLYEMSLSYMSVIITSIIIKIINTTIDIFTIFINIMTTIIKTNHCQFGLFFYTIMIILIISLDCSCNENYDNIPHLLQFGLFFYTYGVYLHCGFEHSFISPHNKSVLAIMVTVDPFLLLVKDVHDEVVLFCKWCCITDNQDPKHQLPALCPPCQVTHIYIYM